MKLEEFYARFENADLKQKSGTIDIMGYGGLTLYDIYMRLIRIEAQIRPFSTERDDLLEVAKRYFDNLPKKRLDYRDS